MIKLNNAKEINKPKVKILKTDNGYAYHVLCEDTFKLTKEPLGYHIFAYTWTVPITNMCKSLEEYMKLKGIKN